MDVQFILNHRGRMGEILNCMPTGTQWSPGDVTPPLCVKTLDIGDITPEMLQDNQYKLCAEAFQIDGKKTIVHESKIKLELRERDDWKSWRPVEQTKAFLRHHLGDAAVAEFEKTFADNGGRIEDAKQVAAAKMTLLKKGA